jgi:hypothetical protein
MSGSEIAVIAGSSVAGAVSAALLGRLSSRTAAAVAAKTKSEDKNEQQKEEESQPTVGERMGVEASAARSQLASLMFEKGLAAEALTRVYEAAQEGKIDRLERDRLLVKYKQELDALNERIALLQPVADYADLEAARASLASLVESKLAAIDAKLAEMSKAGARPIVVEKVQVMPTPEKVKDDREARQFRAEEKSIEQLQKEIMQALTRLEQVEMDKD